MSNRNLILAAAGQAGDYQISRSLRFNSADSAYLSRTPASAGNLTTWTYSAWIKLGKINTDRILFSAISGSNEHTLYIDSNNRIDWYDYPGSFVARLQTTQVFRDVSAWYHIVAVWDTGNATAGNRMRLYINGSEVTAFGIDTNPTISTNSIWNTAIGHRIGDWSNASIPFDGYMADINFIDGQALTPSSFGEVNEDTGVWSPIKYAGTYGTNGFHLEFADNSDVTATTLGKDDSGNGNNWTPSGSPGFSVTAGAGNDSLVDTPTPYGTDTGAGATVRGNYATLNPLNQNSSGTLSNGNLQWQASGASTQVVTATQTIIPSGKTYFEVDVVTAAIAGTYFQVGIAPFGKSLSTDIGNASGNGYSIEQNQADNIQLRLNGTSVTVSTVVQTNDVLQVAVDHATGKLWFGLNNTWYDSSGGTTGNPSTGANPTATIATTSDWFPAVNKYNTGGTYVINFGQRPFSHAAPSGFKALVTTNLPEPTVVQGDEHFNTVLWTGDGDGSGQAITGVGFQPDFLWGKVRDSADLSHRLIDSVRGVTKQLYSNTTSAENTNATELLSFDSDGFTVGSATALNWDTHPFVGWCWKADGTGSVNELGTISSTVSANTIAGISIVTYTGTGSAATVGHGLGAAPSMIIVKSRDEGTTNYTANWYVYHVGLSASEPQNWRIQLNLTSGGDRDTAIWGSTAPTSSVFSVGSYNNVNYSGDDFVALVFSEVEGFSKFSSYTGNSSVDGPFVFTGFRPAFVMVKRTDSTGFWAMLDNSRPSYNVTDMALYANVSNAESTPAQATDFLSNGFKPRTVDSDVNSNGGTHIYMAFAENPFKNSLAR